MAKYDVMYWGGFPPVSFFFWPGEGIFTQLEFLEEAIELTEPNIVGTNHRGHYMTPAQAMHYVTQAKSPQNYHRFALSLL